MASSPDLSYPEGHVMVDQRTVTVVGPPTANASEWEVVEVILGRHLAMAAVNAEADLARRGLGDLRVSVEGRVR